MAPAVVKVPWEDGSLRWSEGLAGREAGAQRLLRGFREQTIAAIEPYLGPFGGAAIVVAARVASGLNALLGANFRAEIDDVADAVGVNSNDLLLANLAYDLANSCGCSTLVLDRSRTPLHARNLDWPFPGRVLRDQTTVFHTVGAPSGDYAMVGWPGLVGALTAVAPGRFSVTMNYVHHATESDPGSALARAVGGCWPVPWLVRQALDQCESFDEAVEMLSETSILSPVLFTVAGPEHGQAVAIERGPTDFCVRETQGGLLRTTNHYVSEAYAEDNEEDLEDSVLRLGLLEDRVGDARDLSADQAIGALSHEELLHGNTQHQVVMSPATGELAVDVPGRGRVETIVRDLSTFEVECPSSGAVIWLTDGVGTYECPDCEMNIEVDADGAEHPDLPEVDCPESGRTIELASDGEYACPDCDQTIEVEDGVAYHPMLVECPVADEEVWVKAEEGTYECPQCGLEIVVADDDAEHAAPEPLDPGPRSRRRPVRK